MVTSALVSSDKFKVFKRSIQKKSASIHDKIWSYYQAGPHDVSPLVCLHSSTGTAESFFLQLSSLSARGYHVVAVTIPDISDFLEFVKSFELFLTTIVKFRKIHLFGVGLGGFLSQVYAFHRPTSVLSLVLSNTFCDNALFHSSSSMLKFMPEFVIRRSFLSNFPQGEVASEIADAVDFIVHHMNQLSRSILVSRLELHSKPFVVPSIQVPDHFITVIDACDVTTIPAQARNEVYKRYPNAKHSLLKSGGEFIMLSAADEVSVFLQVHLRNYQLGVVEDDNEDVIIFSDFEEEKVVSTSEVVGESNCNNENESNQVEQDDS
ncbi:hypothetical protein RCL1_007301 [Eukaryota sp. TZLM3-RCL]